MTSFDDILKSVNKAFKLRKPVDFEEYGLHITLEILDTIEEIKVLESIKGFESGEYVEGLKRHTLAFAIKALNDISLDGDSVEYGEAGKKVSKSKFIFLREYIGKWPSSLVDAVFGAYSNMQLEVEKRLSGGMKFQNFQMEEPPKVEETKQEFQQVEEDEADANLTEAEKLAKQVEKEQEQAEAEMARGEQAAGSR